MKKLIAAVLVLTSSQLPAEQKNLFDRAKSKLMRTHAGFHISRYYNKIRYGSSFTLNQIAGDPINNSARQLGPDGIYITYNKLGIQAINDGKKTPLLLGSIPCKQKHIDRLKESCTKKSAHNGSVSIHTFNEPWECDAAGLTDLIKNNKQLIQYRYPTPDFSSPSLIDVIRQVRDLENRDDRNHQAALVHCKAGRGRSALGVGAYIAHVIHKAKLVPTIQDITAYLVARRPQVQLNEDQKNTLVAFIKQLREAGSFEKMYEKHSDAVAKRDQEIEAQL